MAAPTGNSLDAAIADIDKILSIGKRLRALRPITSEMVWRDLGAFDIWDMKDWRDVIRVCADDIVMEVLRKAEHGGHLAFVEPGFCPENGVPVNRELLREESVYFRSVLKEVAEGNPKGEAVLPNVDRKTFAVFRNWLYRDTFDVKGYGALIKQWALGETLGSFVYKNVVLSAMVEKFYREDRGFEYHWTETLYKSSHEGCMLRKLWVDMCLHRREGVDVFQKKQVGRCAEFLQDVASKHAKKGDLGPLRKEEYYEVEAGVGRVLERGPAFMKATGVRARL
jgi:hypothetical protein